MHCAGWHNCDPVLLSRPTISTPPLSLLVQHRASLLTSRSGSGTCRVSKQPLHVLSGSSCQYDGTKLHLTL